MRFPELGRRSSVSAERTETKTPTSELSQAGVTPAPVGLAVSSFARTHEQAAIGAADEPDGKAVTQQAPVMPLEIAPTQAEGASAVPAGAPPEDPVIEPLLALPQHGALVAVHAGVALIHAAARLAEPDRGMVLAGSQDGAAGVFTRNLMFGTAIILRGEEAVAVLHEGLAPDQLGATLLGCIEEFEGATGELPAVTLAWNPVGYQELVLTGQEGEHDLEALNLLPEAERQAHAQTLLARRAEQIMALANTLDAVYQPTVIEAPQGSLHVPIEGDIDPFEHEAALNVQWDWA